MSETNGKLAQFICKVFSTLLKISVMCECQIIFYCVDMPDVDLLSEIVISPSFDGDA